MCNRWKVTLLLVAFFAVDGNANECVPRSFGEDKIVCVCNATYCDGTPDPNPKVPKEGSFYWYVSSKQGLRLKLLKDKFGACENSDSVTVLDIDTDKRYQTIFGFGGAFTDSSGINIRKLSPPTQKQLIKTYFDPKLGSRYLLGRVPIGGSDFSTRSYTYDDFPNDTTLQHFGLAKEDYDYKIPFLQMAKQLNPEVKFFSAAWSAPPWMKTNDKVNGFGLLKTEYYQLYADYLMKFLDAYKKFGLDMWAISTGNEPLNAFIPFDNLNSMGWTPNTMGDWVANNLGPTLLASNNSGTQIIVLDDQRLELPWFIQELLENEKVKQYIVGTAVHWYTDYFIPPSVLDETHDSFPDKIILMTEACTGSAIWDIKKVILGSWERGEKYILSMIQYMNHWAVGWVDWNIALDKTGGPNWIKNFVDSPIIVNPDQDEFFKQPMYYALKHFSRFVDRGSVRISITNTTNTIKATAFVKPSKEVVVVLYNENDQPSTVTLNDLNRGQICLQLPARSMNTVIYAE